MKHLILILTFAALTAHGQEVIEFGPGGGEIPSQTGNAGRYLTTDGTNTSWATLSGGGDMAAATYDPGGVAADVYDRANHTGGTDSISTDQLDDSNAPSVENWIQVDASDTTRIRYRTDTQAIFDLGLDPDLPTFVLPASTTISTFGATLVDDVGAGTARGTLGLGSLATENDVDLASEVTGNLPVGNLNSGTGASSSTFWRGDGTWSTPAGGGGLSNVVEDTTPQLGGQLDVNANAIGDGTLELLTFTEDASAVNHVNIENEATGSGPIISAAGDDTNVDLNLNSKGSGTVNINGSPINDISDPNSDDILFWDDSDGGIEFLTLGNGLSITNNIIDVDAATTTADGAVELATTAEATTGTDTVRAVTPDALADSTFTDSLYWPGGSLISDGTQCADPAKATINSGPVVYSVICTDNAASIFYGDAIMPDGYDGGTVTFELASIQTAADTNILDFDFSAQCRGDSDAINSTWGTAQNASITFTTANDIEHATTAALTPDGTCAAGDTLFWRAVMDDTATTTAVATANIVGVKMEYTTVRSD